MTPGRILFLGLILVAGALYLLNPGEEAFREYLTEQAAERAGQGRSGLEGFVADRLGRAAGSLASDLFERENYYVASVYTADLNGRQVGGEWTFLGIAGTFFPIERPDEDR